ncbi:hypothetical protein MHH81_17935 [Psychrobacillus sp. FSL H8-0484]|uniref:hypothetical protein n=1 Tax=Psychrobacillus sp. FSL H8-0484 TaxID=2921390 RepID=UPI0030F66798
MGFKRDTYNADAFKFHLNLYGLLSMHYDKTEVVPVDFTTRLHALKEKIDGDIFIQAGISSEELVAEIDNALAVTEEVNAKVAN